MSDVSFIERLLDGVEVEWKSLGTISTLRRGRVMSKGYLAENAGDYPVYSSQTANNGMIGKIDTFDFDGEFISWTTDGANAGTVFYRTGKFSITNVCGLIKINDESILNYRYLFYWLTIEAQKHVYSGMGNPKLMSHQVEKIPVPIPCPDNPKKSLEIQAEIVRILDAFTAMTAELTAELNLRKKQYNYYRDQLLSFEEGEVEWKTLGEVCGFRNGFAFKSNLFREAGLPIVRITNLNGSGVDLTDVKYFDPTDYRENTQSYSIVRGDILIAMSGATTGKIGCFDSTETAYLNQRVGKFVPDSKSLDNRYLYHFLLSKTEQIYVLAGGGAQPNLSSKVLMEKMLIPIPYANDPIKSIFEQKRIADILDKLDILTNSITEGLPREIELRQKQYEYYRDLLLSFPKQDAEVAA